VIPESPPPTRVSIIGLNPSISRLGLDLYYNMRNMSPAQALEESAFALLAALGAEDENAIAQKIAQPR